MFTIWEVTFFTQIISQSYFIFRLVNVNDLLSSEYSTPRHGGHIS